MADEDRTPTANITPFGLRMQPSLKARVEDAARDNERSMNSEIIARLEDSFTLDQVSDFPGFSAAEKASMLHGQLEHAREKLKNSIELPDSLKKRINRRASETGRTAQEEVVLALEKAFPPASETDQMISLIEDLLGEHPDEVATIAGEGLRQYLKYLKDERDAGRAEGAYARINEVFTKNDEGRTVRRK